MGEYGWIWMDLEGYGRILVDMCERVDMVEYWYIMWMDMGEY